MIKDNGAAIINSSYQKETYQNCHLKIQICDQEHLLLFPQVMVMTGGGPLGSTQVIVERIYVYGFRYLNMGYATALSVILLTLIITVTIIQLLLQRKWVYYE